MSTLPSEGSKRCMIYRFDRTLDDGCLGCRRSETYCQAVRETQKQPCCPACAHE